VRNDARRSAANARPDALRRPVRPPAEVHEILRWPKVKVFECAPVPAWSIAFMDLGIAQLLSLIPQKPRTKDGRLFTTCEQSRWTKSTARFTWYKVR
jgi:hypothetical protein